MVDGNRRVDIVLVLDASSRMKPVFNELSGKLKKFVADLVGEGFESLRIGTVACNAKKVGGTAICRHQLTTRQGLRGMDVLYQGGDDKRDSLFTVFENGKGDLDSWCAQLDQIKCMASADVLLALDCAADYPFEPPCSAQRVIVVFSNGRMEHGPFGKSLLGKSNDILVQLMKKLEARNVTLHYFGADCEGMNIIQAHPGVYVRQVDGDAGPEQCWNVVDFQQILESMRHPIPDEFVQLVADPRFRTAIYRQKRWKRNRWCLDKDGNFLDYVKAGEQVCQGRRKGLGSGRKKTVVEVGGTTICTNISVRPSVDDEDGENSPSVPIDGGGKTSAMGVALGLVVLIGLGWLAFAYVLPAIWWLVCTLVSGIWSVVCWLCRHYIITALVVVGVIAIGKNR